MKSKSLTISQILMVNIKESQHLRMSLKVIDYIRIMVMEHLQMYQNQQELSIEHLV